MRLKLSDLRNKAFWESSGIALPEYPYEAIAEISRSDPRWVHFGIGNIFRIFLGGIADELLNTGLSDHGITCMEAYDDEIVDRIYEPHDNLTLAVTLYKNGCQETRVLASFAEALKVSPRHTHDWERAERIFSYPGLQMVSFTITEKGYALRDSSGDLFQWARQDMKNGPESVTGIMGIVTALLYARYKSGAYPLALVSMDNVSRNGEKLKVSVQEMAKAWVDTGFAPVAFLKYVSDETKITYPWTMIDKITPSPSYEVAQALQSLGLEDIMPIETQKHTRIAPFVNAEAPQYLVIEDSFPNGRPLLEKAGVYMTDRSTVNLAERMKVTACLNPIHTALAPYDVMLGYRLFADGMSDPDLSKLAYQVGYKEGLPVVEDPKILSPKVFLDEVMNERFPNVYLGDTSQRICVDISQGVAFRFGETVHAHVRKNNTENLIGIPLAIAGWMRYLLGVNDRGEQYELSPDPMIPEIKRHLQGIKWDQPESLQMQLRPVLSNSQIFGLDLYEAGIGSRIESLLREELAGLGAVRETLRRSLSSVRKT